MPHHHHDDDYGATWVAADGDVDDGAEELLQREEAANDRLVDQYLAAAEGLRLQGDRLAGKLTQGDVWPSVDDASTWSALTSAASARFFDDVSTVAPDLEPVLIQVQQHHVTGFDVEAVVQVLAHGVEDSGPLMVDGPDSRRKIARLLKNWSRLSVELTTGSGKTDFFIAAIARTAATAAVRAARKARDAVVHRERSYSQEVVGRFVTQWLGLRATSVMVDAAANALLHEDLDLDVEPQSQLVKRLRLTTLKQRRGWRPIEETQLRGTNVEALDRRLHLGDGGGRLTLADTLAHHDTVDPRVDGWADQRVARILARLHADERRVALAYAASGTRVTWPEAAQLCDLPETFGERVRRKLLRLGERFRAAGGGPRLA